MSGICGQFNLNHAPADPAELRSMIAMLNKRGPDRNGMCESGPAGLGHTLLATTPELVFERQPFEIPAAECSITADVRLDNRDELLRSLNHSERGDTTGDAELILLAYLKWGEACLDHLIGDFAFALWDGRKQLLFCARDHLGMRPFYYHHAPGQHVLFASDARAILVLPRVPYQLNDGRIADFLVPQLEWIDYTSTFYKDVFRLPPGHKLTATVERLAVSEYWRPTPCPATPGMSDDDYAQGFLEVFTRSVDARMRTPPNRLAAMLSGGVDSGSVVAVASNLLAASGADPLPTISAIGVDAGDCEEARAIHAAIRMPGISPELISADEPAFDPLALIADLEEPFDSQCLMIRCIYHRAAEMGANVVLDGAGGDVILSEGTYIMRLLRQGQLIRAATEISGEARFWGGSPTREFLRYVARAYVPEAAKKVLRRIWHDASTDAFLGESLISRDFANSVNITERRERLQAMFPGVWTPDYALERSNAILPNLTAGRERYARAAASCAVEARDPFMDKRLVDYCSSLPGRLRMQQGWPKSVLRKLMTDRLPEEVLWLREKPHVGWQFNVAVTQQAQRQDRLNLNEIRENLRNYVEPQMLDLALQGFISGDSQEPLQAAHMLSLWLDKSVTRPLVP